MPVAPTRPEALHRAVMSRLQPTAGRPESRVFGRIEDHARPIAVKCSFSDKRTEPPSRPSHQKSAEAREERQKQAIRVDASRPGSTALEQKRAARPLRRS